MEPQVKPFTERFTIDDAAKEGLKIALHKFELGRKIATDIFNPVFIENLPLSDFIIRHPSLFNKGVNLQGGEVEIKKCDGSSVNLLENMVIPTMLNANNTEIHFGIPSGKKQYNGFVIHQQRGDVGLFNLVTTKGKSAVALYKVENGAKRVFYFVSGKVNRVHNISIPSTIRSLTSVLTENDKIAIINKSAKFKKSLDTACTIKQALEMLEKMLKTTVDYNYITSILEANLILS